MLSTRKTLIQNAFDGRVSATEADSYRRFFRLAGVPDAVACGVKQVLEDVLDADLSSLRAEDDFSTNLGFFFERDSMADVEIVVELEKRFNIRIADSEAANVSTIEEIVFLVWSKLEDLRTGERDGL